jgi:hypothetical protein
VKAAYHNILLFNTDPGITATNNKRHYGSKGKPFHNLHAAKIRTVQNSEAAVWVMVFIHNKKGPCGNKGRRAQICYAHEKEQKSHLKRNVSLVCDKRLIGDLKSCV